MRRNAPLALSIFFTLLFLLLLGRLAQLMLVQGEELSVLAEAQHTRSLDYYQYARGEIVDRLDRPITGQEENCAVVFPAMLRDPEGAAAFLAGLWGCGADQVRERIAAAGPDAPYVLRSGLTAEQARAIAEADIEGLVCLTLAARYPASGIMSQVVGSCISSSQGWQGFSGLELQYDKYLRGRRDHQLVAYVDADGGLSSDGVYLQKLRPQYDILRLTIDRDYQQIAEQAFSQLGYGGACVIMDPYSGDVLALASAPGYDQYHWQEAAEGAYVNKALSLFSPASTFKTVLAAAALSEGLPLPVTRQEPSGEGDEGAEAEAGSPDDQAEGDDEAEADEQAGQFYCSGSYTLADGHTVRCVFAPEGHGWLDLPEALARSCNCYFVALGQQLGGDIIKEYGARLGLSKQELIGYKLADSAAHMAFDSSIAAAVANASLGEEGIQVSPLQMAALTSVFVNGGYLVVPRLVREVSRQDGYAIRSFERVAPRRVLSGQTADSLCAMLVDTVARGTGVAAAGEYCSAGGKTGTSESGGVWFSGFAPAEEPRWVISVYVENGVSGSKESAAVFRYIIDALTLLEAQPLSR